MGPSVRHRLSPSRNWTISRHPFDVCVQSTCRMDLFAQAKAQGIQTEFLDGQGHRRVTDAAALKIILDALPPQAPGPLVGQPVVVRSGRPSRTELPATARLPVAWKIVADSGAYRQGRELGSRHRLAQGPAARRLPASGERRRDRRGRAADFGAGKGVWRRVRPLLAARGPALRRPLRAQLGHGRLHRPRQPDRTRRSSRRRRRRPQSAACPVRRSPGRLQPLFAEQPAVSQRALYRRRKASRISARFRNKRGAGAVAGRRCRRLRRRRRSEVAGAAQGLCRFQGQRQAGPPTGF